jgi:four helix bundle protein
MLTAKTIKTFEDLESWQISHNLALEVYKATKKFPKDELYGIVSQLRRAALSIMANIAEGFSRYHYKDKIRFYYNSRGSASELKSHLILSKDLEYITCEDYSRLSKECDRALKIVNGLIRSIERQK